MTLERILSVLVEDLLLTTGFFTVSIFFTVVDSTFFSVGWVFGIGLVTVSLVSLRVLLVTVDGPTEGFGRNSGFEMTGLLGITGLFNVFLPFPAEVGFSVGVLLVGEFFSETSGELWELSN